MLQGKSSEEIHDGEGVLRKNDLIYVLWIYELTRSVMEEIHSFRYSIHMRSATMYHLSESEV